MNYNRLVQLLQDLGRRYARLLDRLRIAVTSEHVSARPRRPQTTFPETEMTSPETTADLRINLLVPFGGWSDPANIAFLSEPPDSKNALTVTREGTTIQLWFDEDCAAQYRVFQAHPQLRYAEQSVDKVRVLILVNSVEDDLRQFIAEGRRCPHHDADIAEWPVAERNIEARYEALAASIFESCVQILTRLVEYCRTEKGQHWLRRLEYDPKNVSAFFSMCKAQVSVRGNEWRKWDPPPHVVWVTTPIGDHSRFLTTEDWRQAGEYVRAQSRLNIVRELLVRAEELATEGYRRSALIEAIAALDIALARFMERPTLIERMPSGRRTGLSQPGRLFEKLGLRGTIDFFLPLLLPECSFSESLRKQLQAAVDTRGSIVHKGQRDISEEKLRDYLLAIRTVCNVLEEGA